MTDSKPCLHICLISGQPVPNLLPLLLEGPDRALFVVSPEMANTADRLAKIVHHHGIGVEAPEHIGSAFDFEATVRVCEILMERHKDKELVLNVTGGTKVTALAAFQAFYFASSKQCRIIYCDTTNDELLQLAPESTRRPIRENLVPVRDYLSMYGLAMQDNGHPPTGWKRRKGFLPELATVLIQDHRLLSRLNQALHRVKEGQRSQNFSLSSLGKNGERLAALLQQCGCGEQTTSDNFNIAGVENLFFCRGGWLEEFAYGKVAEVAIPSLDLAMNVQVEWEGAGKRTIRNEFDILFTHRNRLHLISCKAANPDRQTASGTRATEAINELEVLADRAGGLFAKPMLLSARRLSSYDRSRAKRMGIRLVDGQEVLRLETHLQDWLRL